LLKGCAHEIGKAAVDGADLAVEGNGKQDVVEGVDQVPITLLGLGNHGEELIELFVARRSFIAVFHAAH
jgi:hypothetical protein